MAVGLRSRLGPDVVQLDNGRADSGASGVVRQRLRGTRGTLYFPRYWYHTLY